ncbi:MAG TPA: AAA family ATPase [Polyangiaceae bacterium]
MSDEVTVERSYGNGLNWTLEWNEDTAIRNLVTGLPESVQPFIDDVVELERVRTALQEISASATDKGIAAAEIAAAMAHVKAKGLDAIDVRQRIIDLLAPRLPRFFRFTAYSTLPGRIDMRQISTSGNDGPATSGKQAARALLALAGTDVNQLSNENYELRKGELEAVQIDLTNQVFEYWKQNPDLEVLIDVDKETVKHGNATTAVVSFLDIRLRDKRTGYSNNFTQRSSGFQWFFSFLAAFSEFEGKECPIVLLDEPALTLHGKAQGDFLRFINERLAPSSPVIYTTHSPFMVEANRLERVRIVEDNGPPNGATVSDGVFVADPDSLFPLQAALGYDIAQNLFVGPHNLVVEGTSEYIYLTIMSGLCRAADREPLDERWRILPAGGASNIPTFVSLVGPHLDVTVLADSDTKGMQRVTSMIERNLLAGHRLIMASVATPSEHADIEDLFGEADYVTLYNKTYSTSVKLGALPEGDRIVKRLEAHTKKEYIHGEVAETLLRFHQEMSFSETSLERFELLIHAINTTLKDGALDDGVQLTPKGAKPHNKALQRAGRKAPRR